MRRNRMRMDASSSDRNILDMGLVGIQETGSERLSERRLKEEGSKECYTPWEIQPSNIPLQNLIASSTLFL